MAYKVPGFGRLKSVLPVLALLPLMAQYQFPVGQSVSYRVEMRFDGFMPLLGGEVGKATVQTQFTLTGQAVQVPGTQSAKVSMTAFDLTFNDFRVPIDLDDAQKYFPTSTVTFSALGSVTAWDAPKLEIPIRLPGLDRSRLPQLIFLPVHFPSAGLTIGEMFSFSDAVPGGTADWKVTPTAITDQTVEFKIAEDETYSALEDEALNIVPLKDAVSRVVTHQSGQGSATFDRKKGRFTRYETSGTATGEVENLTNHEKTERSLQQKVSISS